MTHLCQPHLTSTMSGPMTEDTWGPPHVCPGAEVRQGGSGRQGSRVTILVGWDRAVLGLCGLSGLSEATGDIRPEQTDLLHVHP